MKPTRLISLMQKYIDAEDRYNITRDPADAARVLELNRRVRLELNWLNERRAEALARFTP